MKTWTTPWGLLKLSRFPYDGDETQQAWNGADTLILEEFHSRSLAPGSLVIVYNDSFGALSTTFLKAGLTTVQISDSSLSQRATLWNLDLNGLSSDNLFLLDSLTVPNTETGNSGPTTVVLKLPKSLSLLEFQLHQIRSFLPAGSTLWAAGMTKEVHNSTLELFEKLIGPTETSLANHKARMIVSKLERREQSPNPFPSRWSLPGLDLEMINHASVFSREGLDEGTRLLLRHFPRISNSVKSVVDLGCGNGLLGLAAAQRAPEAEIFCVDESFMAVWSARESFRANHLGGRGTFLCGDCLEDFDKASIDLILCNPPFHYQNGQTLEVAHRMFDDAARVLKPAGELWVVANRHLGHHKALEARFDVVRTAGIDEKFVVFQAKKPKPDSANRAAENRGKDLATNRSRGPLAQ